jgi:hypothetical protein
MRRYNLMGNATGSTVKKDGKAMDMIEFRLSPLKEIAQEEPDELRVDLNFLRLLNKKVVHFVRAIGGNSPRTQEVILEGKSDPNLRIIFLMKLRRLLRCDKPDCDQTEFLPFIERFMRSLLEIKSPESQDFYKGIIAGL